MAQDVKVSVQTAVNNQDLIPATISSELEQKFIKKCCKVSGTLNSARR